MELEQIRDIVNQLVKDMETLMSKATLNGMKIDKNYGAIKELILLVKDLRASNVKKQEKPGSPIIEAQEE
jgi:hypothetical protein